LATHGCVVMTTTIWKWRRRPRPSGPRAGSTLEVVAPVLYFHVLPQGIVPARPSSDVQNAYPRRRRVGGQARTHPA
jgi:hypothetical protein